MDEKNIPIDLAVRKLLDWLISRRVCGRDWHDSVVKIREKIGHAMQDMPENEAIRKLLHGTHINYFHCIKIIEILKETEADSKNFFGQYGSQRMKDWKDIVSEYERGGVYLAEAAQILIQNTAYEIPGLKKQIAKCEQTQSDCDKKEENSTKRIQELEQEYKKQCQQLGIKGEKVKQEIIELAKSLPDTYDRMASSECPNMVAVKDACDLYESFVQQAGRDDEGVVVVQQRVVENLRFLLEHGDVTTYQWKYGEKPITVEPPEIVFNDKDEDEENQASGEIDFGDDAGIDFGDDTNDQIDFGGDIDFGDSGGEIDFGEGGDGEIDFGADIDFNVDTSAIVVEEGGMAGGVARHEEALSLLDNRRTRTMLLDELEEVSGFLTQRLVELEDEGSGSRFSLTTSSTISQDPDTVRSYLNGVKNMINELTEVKMQQLQLIRGSPEYADRLVDTIKQKLKLVEKVKLGITEIQSRKESALEEMVRCQEQLKTFTARTKELQAEMESDISKRYKGRPVYITGIN